MPCGTEVLTAAQQAKKEQALRDLEKQIAAGKVKVMLDRMGKATLDGWETDRENPGHWHDDCAYRKLLAEGSSALRMVMARAQTDRMGRTVTN
jgi:hypothetical protein